MRLLNALPQADVNALGLRQLSNVGPQLRSPASPATPTAGEIAYLRGRLVDEQGAREVAVPAQSQSTYWQPMTTGDERDQADVSRPRRLNSRIAPPADRNLNSLNASNSPGTAHPLKVRPPGGLLTSLQGQPVVDTGPEILGLRPDG